MRERKIGGYTLLEEIGCGGMGTVYEAVNDGGDHVALKLLHPSVAADESSRERLRREVAVLRRVRSPYVAEVIDAEFDAVEPFIVTELVRGLTLEEDVQVNGLYTDDDLYQLGYQLGQALAAVHRGGVLHRDMKPSNVMLCSSQGESVSQPRPILIDFGIAQLEDSTRLTQPGSLAFTPSYCDPRMIEGAPADEEGDWWALSAVLAYAACGEPPFGRGSASAVIHRVLVDDISMPDVDPDVQELFRRALRKDINERLSYEELLNALRDPASMTRSIETIQSAETIHIPRIAPTVVADPIGDPDPTINYGHAESSMPIPTSPAWEGSANILVDPRVQAEPAALVNNAAVFHNAEQCGAPPAYSGTFVSQEGAALPLQSAAQQYTMPMQYAMPAPGHGAYMQPDVGLNSDSEPELKLEPARGSASSPDVPLPSGAAAPQWGREPHTVRLVALLLWVAILCASTLWPLPVALIFLVAMLLCDVVGTCFLYVRDRRLRKGGVHRGDHFACLLRFPLLLLKSAVRTVGICAIVILPVALVYAGYYKGVPEYVPPLAYGIAAAWITMLMWLLPTGRSARLGLRILAGGMSSGSGVRRIWLVAAVCVVVFVIVCANSASQGMLW